MTFITLSELSQANSISPREKQNTNDKVYIFYLTSKQSPNCWKLTAEGKKYGTLVYKVQG